MSAAAEAAWLQMIASCQQLEVRKALAQFVVAVLSYVTVCDGKCALAADATFNEQRRNDSHFLFLVNMGAVLQKLFGGGGPVVESTLDTAGECQSKCCETDIISENSSSSSEHTHASRHAQSRPSFETMPPGHAEIPTK